VNQPACHMCCWYGWRLPSTKTSSKHMLSARAKVVLPHPFTVHIHHSNRLKQWPNNGTPLVLIVFHVFKLSFVAAMLVTPGPPRHKLLFATSRHSG
jgi:hypothetical protein